MTVDSIKNGFVIDHIKPGNGMKIYRILGLEELNCPVAIIQKALSHSMGVLFCLTERASLLLRQCRKNNSNITR